MPSDIVRGTQSITSPHWAAAPPTSVCNISDLPNITGVLCDIIADSRQQQHVLDATWRAIVITGYATLIVIGIVSNVIVCCVVLRQWTHRRAAHLGRSSRNLYILNLALADLALCCVCMPLTLDSLLHFQWSMGLLLCKLTPVIQAANMLVSAATVTAIAIDRYNTIVRSMRARNKAVLASEAGRAAPGLAIIWILSLFLTSPLFFFTHLDDVTIGGVVIYQQCVERWPSDTLKLVFSSGITAFQFVIPVIILIFIHLKISTFLNRHLRPLRRPKIEIHSPDVPVENNCENKVAADDDTLNDDRRAHQKEYLNISRKESICSDNSQRSESSRKYSDCSDSKRGSTPDISPRRNFLSSFRESSDFSFSFTKLSRESSRKSPKKMRRELLRNRRTTLLLACIAAVYAVSWLPYHVYNIITHAVPFFAEPSTVYKAFAVAHLLAMTSVCVNPFLYGWLNTNFRRDFRSIFGKRNSCFSDSRRSDDEAGYIKKNYDECLKKKTALSFMAQKNKDCVVVALFSDKAHQPNV